MYALRLACFGFQALTHTSPGRATSSLQSNSLFYNYGKPCLKFLFFGIQNIVIA